jgi:threonine aldolase
MTKIFKGIDLSSDTATLPTLAMKKAMMAAVLGDEQKGEDPTTRQLEEKVAELLGFEKALFLPSATMANQIAIRLLSEPGNALIAAENSHIFNAECGGPAIHSGVMAKAIRTPTGMFTSDDLLGAYRKSNSPPHVISTCLSIENTTNLGGGLAWELKNLHSVLLTAKKLKLKTHLDGARLLNASVKTNTKPSLLVKNFDTVSICLSKGLGCPMGAVLAFPENHLEKAYWLKHLFGGAMRQSGILAAAGIYALDHHLKHLAEDHKNAAYLAQKFQAEMADLQVEHHSLSTNMVFFSWIGKNFSATQFYEACLKKGVRFSVVSENRFRAVTHLNVSKRDIDRAVKVLKEIAHD